MGRVEWNSEATRGTKGIRILQTGIDVQDRLDVFNLILV
jgi:hypothetical protein